MEQLFPIINRTYHEAEIREDWNAPITSCELVAHDLHRCWHFADRMYKDLEHQLQRLRHLTHDLVAMKRDILFGLFHTEECMQEAIGVAAEILASRFLQASNEHGKAEKRAAK